jgi:hypothetical protein
MTQETAQHALLAGSSDRRRIPRYLCSGEAQITCLPLDGALVRGTVRDLGLGGCCIEGIEAGSPFDLGARTEILVEVNSWVFRAMGHVRALRSRSGISVEFLRMSAGGYSMLTDLIADLERPRAVVTRQKRPLERSDRLLPSKSGQGSVLNGSTTTVGQIIPVESVEETSSASNHHAWVRDLYTGASSVDIFV